MDYLTTVLAFLVTLGLLVTFHEYGHFQVARWCGVRVLKFSVGFGKSLFSWKDKHGTEFVVALIPLGGYVKMLDSRNDQVTPEEYPYEFTRKSVWKRIAIVAAGPIANFIFAIVAFWLMFVSGFSGLAPIIGEVEPSSSAYEAGLRSGDEVVSIDGSPVRLWSDLEIKLVGFLGKNKPVGIELESGQRVEFSSAHLKENPKGLTHELGVKPLMPTMRPVVGELVEGQPASQAGFQFGDLILRVEDRPIETWMAWVQIIQDSPGRSLSVLVLRGDIEQEITVTPEPFQQGDKVFGRVGMGLGEPPEYPADAIREVRYGFLESIHHAVSKTIGFTALTFSSIGQMILGNLSIDNLGGPLTIANAAGASANAGLPAFLNFLAIISISLAVLNLLPIPVLDGGHLLFYFYEVIRGKPLPDKVQTLASNLGMLVVFMLIGLSLFIDFSRFFG